MKIIKIKNQILPIPHYLNTKNITPMKKYPKKISSITFMGYFTIQGYKQKFIKQSLKRITTHSDGA